MSSEIINIPTPRWALPFLEPMRYKGLKGGRSSGKSHFFAELVVEKMLLDPYLDFVCLREVQRSLQYSAKKLIEEKIESFGVQSLFNILDKQIYRLDHRGERAGIIIFQGMQDHTARSLKSLEGFNYAWFEEASNISDRSLRLLRPTLRAEDSEIWFSWNPDQPTDPIEKFLVDNTPENAIVSHINFEQNLFCPQVAREEARIWFKNDPDSYGNVWLGDYATSADDQILGGKWKVDDFEIQSDWDGPYYGADWGFSTDPNVIVECYIDSKTNIIYVSREIWGLHIEIDDTPKFFKKMCGCENYVIRADNARPEIVSYMKHKGYPFIQSAEKWPGSIEDGISKLRSFLSIVLHVDCPKTVEECRLYKYKRVRLTDDVLPDIIDKNNHCIDALRYAIEPMTKRKSQSIWD